MRDAMRTLPGWRWTLVRLALVTFSLGLVTPDAPLANAAPLEGFSVSMELSSGEPPDAALEQLCPPAAVIEATCPDRASALTGFREGSHPVRQIAFESAWRKTGPPSLCA